ncbi:MAG: RNA polymerase sigma factor [Oscillospiraceae bacterium]|nr:RNA polymerase sigma factor [Oscillospiraceae bacterium]
MSDRSAAAVLDTAADARALDGLVAEIAAGDRDALAALYRAAGPAVYASALSLLKNRQDAEDVLHDCFLSVWRSAASYRPEGKAMAWLTTIARNLALSRLRERGRRADYSDEIAPEAPPGLDPEEGILLGACLNDLSDEERQIVVLHAVSGYKHREIARALSLPLSTVLSKYSRALKKLKTSLTKGERI